jgi:rod shape-determining protein MreC
VPRNRTLRLAALGSTVQRAASPAYSSSRGAGALRRRVIAGVLVALSLAMITVYFRESESGAMHEVQSVTASALHPFQVGAERVARPFRDGYGWLAGFFHAKSENERLREQVRLLRQQAIQNSSAAQENLELRKVLEYRSGGVFPRGYDQIGAAVITHGASEHEREVVISAGSTDGISLYDPVVTSDGDLVGHVSKTTRDTAQVTLLTDETFAVSGYDVRTNTYGLVRHGQGLGGALILDRVPKDKLVRRNDLIVTAGRRYGKEPSLYPRNIYVGRVTSVDQTDIDIHQAVQIEPFADFSSLSSVWVLVRKNSPR